MAAAAVRQCDELRAAGLERGARCEHAPDLRVGDVRAEAVRAHEKEVAAAQRDPPLGDDELRGLPERLQHHVLRHGALDRLRRHQALIEQELDVGLVLRDLRELAGAQHVRARIAHFCRMGLPVADEHGDDRRAHPLARGLVRRGGDELVGVIDGGAKSGSRVRLS